MHIETCPWTAAVVCSEPCSPLPILCEAWWYQALGLHFRILTSGVMSAHQWVPFLSTFRNTSIQLSSRKNNGCAGGETPLTKLQVILSLPSFWHMGGNSHHGFLMCSFVPSNWEWMYFSLNFLVYLNFTWLLICFFNLSTYKHVCPFKKLIREKQTSLIHLFSISEVPDQKYLLSMMSSELQTTQLRSTGVGSIDSPFLSFFLLCASGFLPDMEVNLKVEKLFKICNSMKWNYLFQAHEVLLKANLISSPGAWEGQRKRFVFHRISEK